LIEIKMEPASEGDRQLLFSVFRTTKYRLPVGRPVMRRRPVTIGRATEISRQVGWKIRIDPKIKNQFGAEPQKAPRRENG